MIIKFTAISDKITIGNQDGTETTLESKDYYGYLMILEGEAVSQASYSTIAALDEIMVAKACQRHETMDGPIFVVPQVMKNLFSTDEKRDSTIASWEAEAIKKARVRAINISISIAQIKEMLANHHIAMAALSVGAVYIHDVPPCPSRIGDIACYDILTGSRRMINLTDVKEIQTVNGDIIIMDDEFQLHAKEESK